MSTTESSGHTASAARALDGVAAIPSSTTSASPTRPSVSWRWGGGVRNSSAPTSLSSSAPAATAVAQAPRVASASGVDDVSGPTSTS